MPATGVRFDSDVVFLASATVPLAFAVVSRTHPVALGIIEEVEWVIGLRADGRLVENPTAISRTSVADPNRQIR
ncbi:hypothetical protein DVK02_14805 [Halobellus sp. Atlit-31R]|nr:hypothetical protein DVK02_14805 [Halobellus sp. Atlit-31R]